MKREDEQQRSLVVDASMTLAVPQLSSHKKEPEGNTLEESKRVVVVPDNTQGFAESITEVFKNYCEKFRPIDKNSKVHVRHIFATANYSYYS